MLGALPSIAKGAFWVTIPVSSTHNIPSKDSILEKLPKENFDLRGILDFQVHLKSHPEGDPSRRSYIDLVEKDFLGPKDQII